MFQFFGDYAKEALCMLGEWGFGANKWRSLRHTQ